MTTIRTATLSGYRNGEFLQFMNNVLSVFKNADTKALMLEERVSELSKSVHDFDEVFMNVTGHELTAELKVLNDQRLKTLQGVKFILQSFLYRTSEENIKNANVLLNNYVMHCAKIQRKSYQHKTAVLKAMLKDWNSEPSLVEAINALDMKTMVDELDRQNMAFDETYFDRARSSVQASQPQEKKNRIRDAYTELTKDTESFARVASDKKPYVALIDELNSVIETNNNPVVLRKGKKKKDSDTIENIDSAFAE